MSATEIEVVAPTTVNAAEAETKEAPKRVYIGNLSWKSNPSDIKKLFGDFQV